MVHKESQILFQLLVCSIYLSIYLLKSGMLLTILSQCPTFFNFLIKTTTNYEPLLNITFSDKLCIFHILFLNSYASSSLLLLLKVCVILDNLLHTTKITSFLTTNSDFIIKSTIRYIHNFSRISFAISFLARDSIQFFIF